MTTSAFAGLVAAVVAALSAPAIASNVRVSGGLKPPPDPAWPQRVDVQQVNAIGDQVLAGNGAPLDWETMLSITCLVRAAPGDEPDAPLDELLQAVSQRLGGLDLAALGATQWDMSPRINWGVLAAGAATPAFAFVQRLLRVRHCTAGSSDLSAYP
jgi:hypothetical protein